MFYGLIRLKGLLGLLIFGGLWSSTPALATVEDEGYTAIAAAGSQGTQYRTSPRSTLLEASRAALTECRGAEMEGRANGCELIELNGQVLTTSNQLRARLPDKPYPLFLWEYQIGASTVYLAGSIHILPASLHPLPQPLYDAFDRSDRLVLEVNTQAHTPEALQFKAMQYAMLPPDQSLREVLGAELHADLATIMQPYGMELAPLERFKPAFVTQQLALLVLMSLGYDPTMGVEAHFLARVGSREILELENIDLQLNILFNQPLATQVVLTRELVEQMDQPFDLTAELLGAWVNGDDDALHAAFSNRNGDSPEAKAFMRALMDERNTGMARTIQTLAATKGTYFVLVGAGHFVGDVSIIALLAQQGIHGKRLYSNHRF